MNKKLLVLMSLFITLLVSGCTCSFSKDELIQKTIDLVEKIDDTKENNDDLDESMKIIKFYNELTTNTMNAFVMVESKTIVGTNKKYSNGIIIGSSSQNMYVLVDYNAIYQVGGRYTVMDSYLNSYSVSSVYTSDSETGLAVLVYTTSNNKTRSVKVGEYSEISAYLDSMNQLNKATIVDNIKTSTITYNNTSYVSYYLENVSFNNGTVFINNKNEVMGIYSSKMNTVITSDLIKLIVDFI